MMNGRLVSWWVWIIALALILGLALAGLALTPSGALAEDVARLMETGRWREARAELERATAAHPDDALAMSQLAQVKNAFGDSKGATELAEKAVALDPKNVDVRYALAEVVGDQAQKASILKQMGLAKRFKREAEAAAALDPKHVRSRMGLIVFHCNAPGIAGGDKKKAKALCDEIAAIDPVQGWLARAKMADELKDTTAVEGYFLKAVEAGNDYESRISLASWLLAPQRLKYTEAEKLALEAEKIDPQRSGAYTVLVVVYESQKRTGDVDAVLRRAEQSIPWSRVPHYQAARLTLIDGGDYVRAEERMRYYMTAEPEPGQPTLAHARWRLGLILEKQGRKQEAITELQEALKLKPDLNEAKKDLKRLKA